MRSSNNCYEYYILWIVTLTFLCSICIIASPITSWQIGSSTMPYNSSKWISGFNSVTGYIYLIGAFPDGGSLKFDGISEFSYVKSTPNITYLYAEGSNYCSIRDIIYFNKYGKLAIYDMDNEILTYPWPENNVSQYTMPINTPNACQATDGRYLFILGGGIYTIATESAFQIFDTYTLSWITKAPNMTQARAHSACEVYNGFLYVFGGYDYDSGLRLFLSRMQFVLIPCLFVFDIHTL